MHRRRRHVACLPHQTRQRARTKNLLQRRGFRRHHRQRRHARLLQRTPDRTRGHPSRVVRRKHLPVRLLGR